MFFFAVRFSGPVPECSKWVDQEHYRLSGRSVSSRWGACLRKVHSVAGRRCVSSDGEKENVFGFEH